VRNSVDGRVDCFAPRGKRKSLTASTNATEFVHARSMCSILHSEGSTNGRIFAGRMFRRRMPEVRRVATSNGICRSASGGRLRPYRRPRRRGWWVANVALRAAWRSPEPFPKLLKIMTLVGKFSTGTCPFGINKLRGFDDFPRSSPSVEAVIFLSGKSSHRPESRKWAGMLRLQDEKRCAFLILTLSVTRPFVSGYRNSFALTGNSFPPTLAMLASANWQTRSSEACNSSV
jgi:hypothetical protein